MLVHGKDLFAKDLGLGKKIIRDESLKIKPTFLGHILRKYIIIPWELHNWLHQSICVDIVTIFSLQDYLLPFVEYIAD